MKNYYISPLMNDSSGSEINGLHVRCSYCGEVQPAERMRTAKSSAICRVCNQRISGIPPWQEEIDETLDAWLEGERASVRSRRHYGEPPFR